MKIVCCNEVPIEDIYKAFSEGFSDYMIQMEISQEFFVDHFFGPEGNKLPFSFIAYEDQEAVGLILGGCQTYEGILTLRCGTMCVVPEYRGRGIARALLKKHKQLAKELGCRQVFLECIENNDKALNFYKSSGYELVYHLNYYTKKKHKPKKLDLIQGSMVDYKAYRESVEGHVNWQNETWYLEKTQTEIFYIKHDNDIVGLISANAGKISYLHVKKAFRLNGYGRSLVESLQEKQLKISFSSQGGLDGFIRHIGFEKDAISQVEMYCYI